MLKHRQCTLHTAHCTQYTAPTRRGLASPPTAPRRQVRACHSTTASPPRTFQTAACIRCPYVGATLLENLLGALDVVVVLVRLGLFVGKEAAAAHQLPMQGVDLLHANALVVASKRHHQRACALVLAHKRRGDERNVQLPFRPRVHAEERRERLARLQFVDEARFVGPACQQRRRAVGAHEHETSQQLHLVLAIVGRIGAFRFRFVPVPVRFGSGSFRFSFVPVPA